MCLFEMLCDHSCLFSSGGEATVSLSGWVMWQKRPFCPSLSRTEGAAQKDEDPSWWCPSTAGGVWVEGIEEGQVQRLKKHQTSRGHRECPGSPHPPLHQPRQHRGCRVGQEDLDGGGLHLRCKIEKRLCNLIGPLPVNRRLCAQSTDIRRFWVRIPGRLHDDLLAQR